MYSVAIVWIRCLVVRRGFQCREACNLLIWARLIIILDPAGQPIAAPWLLPLLAFVIWAGDPMSTREVCNNIITHGCSEEVVSKMASQKSLKIPVAFLKYKILCYQSKELGVSKLPQNFHGAQETNWVICWARDVCNSERLPNIYRIIKSNKPWELWDSRQEQYKLNLKSLNYPNFRRRTAVL
jgi:hypothetical protein